MGIKSDRELLKKMHKGITKGIRKAVLEHKRAGRSIAVWRNGRVVHVPPEKIRIKGEKQR